MTAECIAIIGFITTVVAAFGGAALGAHFAYKTGMKLVQEAHKNATDLMNRQEFNKATAAFRASFIKEQRLLSTTSLADKIGTTASEIIKAAIDRHEIAMIRFEPFVCKSKIEEYKKAWNDYAGDSRHFEQYSTARSIDIPAKKQLALSRINALLKFADLKH